ncbi:MAG: hypothetical protein U0797_04770 [Gemmataceae bacterium]
MHTRSLTANVCPAARRRAICWTARGPNPGVFFHEVDHDVCVQEDDHSPLAFRLLPSQPGLFLNRLNAGVSLRPLVADFLEVGVDLLGGAWDKPPRRLLGAYPSEEIEYVLIPLFFVDRADLHLDRAGRQADLARHLQRPVRQHGALDHD